MKISAGMKGIVLVIAMLAAVAGFATSLDFSINITPEFTIPVGPDSAMFTPGGGGTLTADLEFFGFLAPTLEFGVYINPLKNLDKSVILTRFGAGVNYFIYPIPRLKLRAGVALGAYIGSYEEVYTANLFWKAYVQAGFRFTPTFSLLVGAGFSRYESSPEPFYTGIQLGLVADIQLSSLGKKDAGVSVETSRDFPVFPILYASYGSRPIGEISLTNMEQAEIRNVKVIFNAGNYSSAPMLCGEYPLIRKGASVDVPLYALFNEQMLTFTENTKIQAEISVSYELLNAPRVATVSKSLPLNHRNAFTWEDDKIAAAFISPNDPAVLDFSKFVAGLVREFTRPDIDSNLQFAMGLFEGLRLYGLSFNRDLATPYSETRKQEGTVDYIQYPYQTLDFKGGDSDDLAVLFAAVLESVGIHTAYLPLDDDVILAFSLSDAGGSASSFTFPEDFVFQYGKTWVPVRVSFIREGFMNAWLKGSETMREAAASGAEIALIPVEDAWKAYPSIGVPGVEAKLVKPPDEQVGKAFENVISHFIAREIGPRVQELLSGMEQDGGSGRDHNRLGLLYARYSLLKEARSEFETAVSKGVQLAYVNLGNVAYLQKDFESAVNFFQKALEFQPANKAALVGLARAKYELDLFADADELYSQIRESDPVLAERYSYLSSRLDTGGARASSVGERDKNIFWSEDE